MKQQKKSYRIIRGKKYELKLISNKSNAGKEAKIFRDLGYLARVIPLATGEYAVFSTHSDARMERFARSLLG